MKLFIIITIVNCISSSVSIIENVFTAKLIKLCPFQQFLFGIMTGFLEELMLAPLLLRSSLTIYIKSSEIVITIIAYAITVMVFKSNTPTKVIFDIIHITNFIVIISSIVISLIHSINSGESWLICLCSILITSCSNEICSTFIRSIFTNNYYEKPLSLQNSSSVSLLTYFLGLAIGIIAVFS